MSNDRNNVPELSFLSYRPNYDKIKTVEDIVEFFKELDLGITIMSHTGLADSGYNPDWWVMSEWDSPYSIQSMQ